MDVQRGGPEGYWKRIQVMSGVLWGYQLDVDGIGDGNYKMGGSHHSV
jgi:hypothetical protein